MTVLQNPRDIQIRISAVSGGEVEAYVSRTVGPEPDSVALLLCDQNRAFVILSEWQIRLIASLLNAD